MGNLTASSKQAKDLGVDGYEPGDAKARNAGALGAFVVLAIGAFVAVERQDGI